MESGSQDEQHDVALKTVWRNCLNNVGSNRFPSTRYLTP